METMQIFIGKKYVDSPLEPKTPNRREKRYGKTRILFKFFKIVYH